MAAFRYLRVRTHAGRCEAIRALVRSEHDAPEAELFVKSEGIVGPASAPTPARRQPLATAPCLLALLAVGIGGCGVVRHGDSITTTTSYNLPADAGAQGTPPVPTCASLLGPAAATSRWVHVDANGKLTYRNLNPEGDHIMDFSSAGYMGGGVALPVVAVEASVRPSGADDTAAIQAAIDSVSKRPLANGHRGAVLLAAGTFSAAGTLKIAASGVVLRGSGSGLGGTSIQMTGAPHLFLSILGSGSWKVAAPTAITDAYVPAGSTSFHVASSAALAVGDTVIVSRPITRAWIHHMRMDSLVHDDKPQVWLAAGGSIPEDRTVVSIAGNEVTLDVPLADSLDAKYLSPPGATVASYTFAGRISQVGVESLRVVAPPLKVPITAPTYTLLEMGAVTDGWVKDVVGQDQFPGTVKLKSTAKRITVVQTTLIHTVSVDSKAGYPDDFAIWGSQILLQSCASRSERYFPIATHSRAAGPNVVLDFSSDGASWISPHQRWATGLLLDNVDMTGGGSILAVDRGTDGTGHGWTMGWGVVWNSKADSLTIQRPPGSTNWVIGSSGTEMIAAEPGRDGGAPLREGTIDSPGARVTPGSLYLAQLCERLGWQAVANIGEAHRD